MEISDCRKKLNMNYDMSQIVAHRFKKTWASISFFYWNPKWDVNGIGYEKKPQTNMKLLKNLSSSHPISWTFFSLQQCQVVFFESWFLC